MPLTVQQNAIVKNYIAADPFLNGQPSDGNGLEVIATALNALASPAFLLWNTSVLTDALFNAVDRSKYTPVDAADGTAMWTNRCLAAETKMMALDGMLQGRTLIDASKPTIRASLRDACVQLPTGASGAMVTSSGQGAVNILMACTRAATVAEKLLIAATETTGAVTAGVAGFEGLLTNNDIDTARRS